MDWMKKEYGSLKGYLKIELGISDEELVLLQNKFLE
jgi:hypothetical protein